MHGSSKRADKACQGEALACALYLFNTKSTLHTPRPTHRHVYQHFVNLAVPATAARLAAQLPNVQRKPCPYAI